VRCSLSEEKCFQLAFEVVVANARMSQVRMSNEACPGVVVAAFGKVGVCSVSGGYGTADTFSVRKCVRCAVAVRTIGSMLLDRGHDKDVSLLSERFSASYRF